MCRPYVSGESQKKMESSTQYARPPSYGQAMCAIRYDPSSATHCVFTPSPTATPPRPTIIKHTRNKQILLAWLFPPPIEKLPSIRARSCCGYCYDSDVYKRFNLKIRHIFWINTKANRAVLELRLSPIATACIAHIGGPPCLLAVSL